ncbi:MULTISPECIES: hypothetical protein [Pseudomonas]|uniref:Uncharacterized protein n=2 Tax=Pseudomonas TaxID=286 RepID=A0A7G8ACU5_PSEAI|nr:MULTISPECIES: hypothetical protein [Pseudomonas]ALZ46390.1 Hypothetical protein [Pseudomonas putida]QNI15864.1 Hypothetical protein [Pseudomonas aeruginosa]QNI16816.1 Hypothetical protein [Pseudomonas aeruginosa]QNI17309.1 Hypothetical protein [Pseudomonas sp.]
MVKRTPGPGSAAELIAQQGIEALRGRPLKDGNTIVYIANTEVDRLQAEEKEDQESGDFLFPAWRKRVYGGESPDAQMVRWVNLNTVLPTQDLIEGDHHG